MVIYIITMLVLMIIGLITNLFEYNKYPDGDRLFQIIFQVGFIIWGLILLL